MCTTGCLVSKFFNPCLTNEFIFDCVPQTYHPDEAVFARFRDIMQRELASWQTQQPYSHSSYFASLATESLQFSIEDLSSALQVCQCGNACAEHTWLLHVLCMSRTYSIHVLIVLL